MSKALTSAAVGLLREQGRLHLDDEIQTYVPAFPKKQWPVTLRQLMGHVAGVRHYRDDEWGDKPSVHCERASEGVQSFANDPLLFQPETQYRYSTYGWVLVSAAVEAAANEPFFTFMRTQIFEPLGMADTTSDSATAADPESSDLLLPGQPRARADDQRRLLLFRGRRRVPLDTVRPRAVRDGAEQRQVPAASHRHACFRHDSN